MSLKSLLLAGALLLLGAGLLLQTTSVTPQGVSVGKVPAAEAACTSDDCLPPVDGPTIAGPPIDPGALKGKIVLVNFWATWCGPCVQEMPALEAVWKRHRQDGFVIIGLLVDETPDERVKEFVAARGVTYPILRSTPALEGSFGRPDVLPTSYLYGKDGHLEKRWYGDVREGVLEDSLAELR